MVIASKYNIQYLIPMVQRNGQYVVVFHYFTKTLFNMGLLSAGCFRNEMDVVLAIFFPKEATMQKPPNAVMAILVSYITSRINAA